MKKQLQAFILGAFILVSPTYGIAAFFPDVILQISKGSEEIDLEGKSKPVGIQHDWNSISAFNRMNNIEANFKLNIGVVKITIADAAGIVMYTSIVNSGVKQINIPKAELPSGELTITFETDSAFIWGDFES